MFDGSVVSLEENLELSKDLLKECAELNIILEVEAGCVGGEEDEERTTLGSSSRKTLHHS